MEVRDERKTMQSLFNLLAIKGALPEDSRAGLPARHRSDLQRKHAGPVSVLG